MIQFVYIFFSLTSTYTLVRTMSKQRENVDKGLVIIVLVLITNNTHRTMFVTIFKLTRFSFILGFFAKYQHHQQSVI